MKRLLNPGRMLLAFSLLAVPVITGCGGLKGVYADQTGTIMLDIESSDKATFTFAGEGYPCTYQQDGKKIVLDCEGLATHHVATNTLNLTMHDDDSLTSSELPVALRKRN
ncbi:MAG: hypothetical protein WB780_04160 [Candidatus Acidiferrales bacterium]